MSNGEDTSFLGGKPPKAMDGEHEEESRLFHLSIKALLSVILIGAVVLHTVAVVAVVIIAVFLFKVELKDAIDALKVTEPLYTMSGMALAYYFGQQKQKQTT